MMFKSGFLFPQRDVGEIERNGRRGNAGYMYEIY